MTTTAIRPDTCTADRHGTHVAYDWWGCRCPDAREAWRLYRKRLRFGRQPAAIVPAAGTVRRLQALVALGYSWSRLSKHLGVTVTRAAQIGLLPITGHVNRRTAARVKALYDELSTTPGTDRYALTVARRHGFYPPLAWDDDTIDDPAAQPQLGDPDADVVDEVAARRVLDGEDIPLTDAERDLAFRIGLAKGMTVTAISRALHLSGTTARTRAAQLTQAA